MNASDIIKLLQDKTVEHDQVDFKVKGLSIDSREVGMDYCFIAFKGVNEDAHSYIKAAIDKGAKMIIYDKNHEFEDLNKGDFKDVIFAGVKDTKAAAGRVSAEFFDRPSEKLNIIGITGTNGKTTISFLLEHIFRESGFESGLIGTVHYRISDHIMPSKNTTPDVIKLNHLFQHMVDHGLRYCVMEVSSHALDQRRVEGIDFNSAIFTNLSPEHLDYHENMEEYFKAKARLFESLNYNKNAIINIDDVFGMRLKVLTKAKILDYGIENKDAMVRAENIDLGIDQTRFKIITPWGKQQVKTHLIGRHNVYNILAAVCAGILAEIDLKHIVKAVETLRFVPGRLEKVATDSNFTVFVDYAHTEDALKKVLSTLRELAPRKIITVFGCGGDRDREKRPLMGKAASSLSDYVILTNDNPRSELPMEIIKEIEEGFMPGFKSYEVLLNRRLAIKRALELAQDRDFVLIAGKGHETYQIFNDKTIDFDDRKTVQELGVKK